jgi:hypothetical protein
VSPIPFRPKTATPRIHLTKPEQLYRQTFLALPTKEELEGIGFQMAQDPVKSNTLYTLMSPMTRTSLPALVYPAIFPHIKSYYHLDLFLDILGIGTMPDDNRTVYYLLWPQHSRGSIMAPFHFVFYSQGGLLIAIAGSLLIGLLIGVGWTLVVNSTRPTIETCLLGGFLTVFAVFIAGDSVRNSTMVSYGVIWGIIALGILRVTRVVFN